MQPQPHSIADLAEGVGLLTSLAPPQFGDAIAFLREINEPGMRYIDGTLHYSAAYLNGEMTGQEQLQL